MHFGPPLVQLATALQTGLLVTSCLLVALQVSRFLTAHQHNEGGFASKSAVTLVSIAVKKRPVPRDLPWLPVRRRVDCKLALQVYKSLHGLTPSYLSDDCRLVSSGKFCRPVVCARPTSTPASLQGPRLAWVTRDFTLLVLSFGTVCHLIYDGRTLSSANSVGCRKRTCWGLAKSSVHWDCFVIMRIV